MDALLKAAIWSFLPISELRGGIPIALHNGLSVWSAYLICVCVNLLVIPWTYFFLDHLHDIFMKISVYRRIFTHYIEKKRTALEKHIGTKWEFIALMLFVGIPLPITGAYTGTLLAWFFKLPRKKSYTAVGLGVMIAGLIVTLVIQLGLKAFSIFVKS